MKRFLLIISAILSLATLQAQTPYLETGDIVTIHVGYWEQTSWHPEHVYEYRTKYMEASTSGIKMVPYATDNCLWELTVENNAYAFKDLTTGKHLRIKDVISQESALILADNASAFYFTDKGSQTGEYMYGQLYYNTVTPWGSPISLLMSQYDDIFMVAGWNPSDLYIEKWEKKGNDNPTGHFSPSKIEFSYIGDQEGENEKDDDPHPVTFMIEATTESYYQCIRRQDEALLRRTTNNVAGEDVKIVDIYWESDSINRQTSPNDLESNLNITADKYIDCPETDGRAILSLSKLTDGQDGQWQFTITPEGASPMGLKQKIYEETVNGTTVGIDRWVDYADRVVVEYQYGESEPQKAHMRVVRKSYREEELPTLTFSINPLTYTFTPKQESKVFTVVATHQHGKAIYNVDNQIIDTTFTVRPEKIDLTNENLKLTSDKEWLTAEIYNNSEDKIIVTAANNESGAKRYATLTGTLSPQQSGNHEPVDFTIPLEQRAVQIEGGIKFYTQAGEGATDAEKENWNSEEDQQKVHTVEKTIYYLPNQAEIELRLQESGYSGYMRWYDYETGGDPYYNYTHEGKQATSWVRSPRGNQDKAFSAINTPRKGNTPEEMNDIIANEGHSHGLYSLNKADGGALDEANPYNNNPILKGWEDGVAHIMACDVSAYTDYTIEKDNHGQITSITEPTLSYRQIFHLRPAQEMADTLKARSERGVYLEEYKYQAPAGKQILLATQYRYKKARSHSSEMCYFFKDNWGNLRSIHSDVPVQWYVQTKDKNGNWSEEEPYDATYSAEMDYLIVRNETYPATKRYSLKLPHSSGYLYTKDYTTDLLIARFEVEFVDIETQGPTNKTIITQQRINTLFKNLEEINFNVTTGHLPWEQASYGYVYTTGNLAQEAYFKRGASQGCFPFYGEYTILESVNKDWAKGAAHGGTGKALYVDGTMEPGLVASITAKAKICSGQTMYCSAWFCNPTPSGWTGEGNPIFRCNIQGKNKNEEEWHDAGVYFVGELLKGSGWQQIVFPIQSASSYDSTRVSIYNFATTNQGNDFMVDDITLFVSQLPIAAYKGEMACRSIEGGTTTAAAVLRLDYSNINAGSDGYMYYQIYNKSYENKENGEVVSKGAAVNLTGENAAYYHDYDVDHGGDHEHPYGSIHIPQKDFDPEVHNSTASKENKVLIYTSVSAFLDDLVLEGKKNGKAYIRTQQSGVTKWLLYVVHLVESTTQNEINKEQDQEKRKQIPLQKLFDEHQYVMRMAYTPEELPTAECNLTTPLYATQETLFRLRNSDKKTISHTEIGEANNEGEEMYIHTKSTNNCPNDLYFLTSTVINHLAVDGAGGNTDNIAAPIFSDWLIGDPQGDVLSEKAPSRSDYNTDNEYQTALTDYNARLQAAVAGFKDMYGYTHDEVTSAIMYDMRRHSTDDPNSRDYNPNYKAKIFEELQPNRFLSRENYEIVKHLHDNGWLQLCDTTVHFYLGTRLDKEEKTIGDTVRYWCFPIAETAKTIVDVAGKATEITLKDCNEPHRVTVSIAKGSYYMNITPIEYAKKTPQQHVQLPTLKVLEGSNEITIPITQSGNTKIAGANLETRQITLSLDDPNLTYFDLETGEPYQEKPTLEVGNEYTIRLTLKESHGWEYPEDNSSNCRVGYVFATIQIVPNTLVWTPVESSFNGWGKDENWKGWVDKDKDNVIDKTDNPTTNELCEGYVPISGADVIIPKLDNTLLYPYIVPEHTHNHYPMTVGFQPHHCNNIYFAPGAKLYNQHLLEYDTAFVDMQFPAAKWHLVSAPLQGMVSGDMFVPHYGWYDEEQDMRVAEPNPFEVSEFKGIRHADAAYAFWEAFYNTNVDGSNTLLRDFDNIQFTQSNTLAQELKAGHGYAVYGLGWKDTAMLTVRLPKPDKSYAYFADGKETGNSISIPQENRGRLAYTDDHDQQGMTITLTNNTASEYFLFGNPTMAFVDMHALYLDNKSQWSGVFKTIQGDVINATTPSTMTTANRYLPPMTSALLKVNDKATEEQKKSMVITLLPSHLTLNNMINPAEASDDDQAGSQPQAAPARRIAGIDERPVNHEAVQSELMTIYAFTPKGTARTVLATNPAANDYYTSGEDALFTSSGVENESYVTTPLNMYTVAEQVPMMADVRQGISNIPLAILAAEGYHTQYMQVAFYLTSNWSRECYFVDHKTGQKIRIMDGLVISVEMPENHEQRYSIEGPDSYKGSDGVTTSTTQPTLSTTGNKVWAYAPDHSTVVVSSSDLIKSATLYDLTGRLVASSSLNSQHSTLNSHLMTNSLTLHTMGTAGVYIVDVTLRDGSTERAQVIVP